MRGAHDALDWPPTLVRRPGEPYSKFKMARMGRWRTSASAGKPWEGGRSVSIQQVVFLFQMFHLLFACHPPIGSATFATSPLGKALPKRTEDSGCLLLSGVSKPERPGLASWQAGRRDSLAGQGGSVGQYQVCGSFWTSEPCKRVTLSSLAVSPSTSTLPMGGMLRCPRLCPRRGLRGEAMGDTADADDLSPPIWQSPVFWCAGVFYPALKRTLPNLASFHRENRASDREVHARLRSTNEYLCTTQASRHSIEPWYPEALRGRRVNGNASHRRGPSQRLPKRCCFLGPNAWMLDDARLVSCARVRGASISRHSPPNLENRQAGVLRMKQLSLSREKLRIFQEMFLSMFDERLQR